MKSQLREGAIFCARIPVLDKDQIKDTDKKSAQNTDMVQIIEKIKVDSS